VSYAWFEVPTRYPWWVFNFVFHRTFLFEAVVILWAALLLIKEPAKSTSIEEVDPQ